MDINNAPGRGCEDRFCKLGEAAALSLVISGQVPLSCVKKLLVQAASILKKYENSSAAQSAPTKLLSESSHLLSCELQTLTQLMNSRSRLKRSGSLPALLVLCSSLINATDGRPTHKQIEDYFCGCRKSYVLSGAEPSLLIPFLKISVISELSELYSSPVSSFSIQRAENLFASLHFLSQADFSETVEELDPVIRLLRLDPSGVFPLMSAESRLHYRQSLLNLAKKYGKDELSAAKAVLSLAENESGEKAHVGYWIFRRSLGSKPPQHTGLAYILSLAALTLCLCIWSGLMLQSISAALLMLLPVYGLAKFTVDTLLISVTPPTQLPSMELKTGVPPEGKTLCVICALLTGSGASWELCHRLEEFSHANSDCGKELLFGLLADLPDSSNQSSCQDQELLSEACDAVNSLNQKYGGGFFLFTRPREYNNRQKRFMAWERKRGAILGLAQLLSGEASRLILSCGNGTELKGVRYLLTLDEDTRLTPGSARKLIGAMLHPLNRPIIDSRRVVCRGYGLIHPRISTELSSGNKSSFSGLFSGEGSSDPYGSAAGELYMDMFDNGSFFGKGILDMSAYLQCLDGRIPENQVLSHDALEGAFLHGGFLGSVELTDGFPADTAAYFRRLHRWTRGDWQNLPWLFGAGRGLPPLYRFRLFDSLCRSLIPPACLLSMICAFLSPTPPMAAAAIVSLLCVLSPLLARFRELFAAKNGTVAVRTMRGTERGTDGELRRCFLRLLLLPSEAYICLNAAVSSLWRMVLHKKGMLNWSTASSQASRKNGFFTYLRLLWPVCIFGAVLFLLSPSVLGKTAALLWIMSPLTAMSLSKPHPPAKQLSEADRCYLLQKAKQLWSYFQCFCTPDSHWLPPDNYQPHPPLGADLRSSPTNMGLCLVCCLAALDLKLCQPETAVQILSGLLHTMDCLPKWQGHFYNWYDNHSLKPLSPAYISTVDSGNLAACLYVLRQGLSEHGLPELSALCSRLLEPMGFAPLYDENRRLLSIGFDVTAQKPSEGCYDLFCSEALTASFIALARGDIPLSHWVQLGRPFSAKGRYHGPLSWSGSMFEYLMPRLFFKPCAGSFTDEAHRFCLRRQMLQGARSSLPWGISESAYYCLNANNRFCYKAQGCRALALSRNTGSGRVVSPYSSFLALGVDKSSAIANLRQLETVAGCDFGFWEAVDFSADKPRPISCVMAHHLGMSLAAVLNALKDDLLCKRIKSQPLLSAYLCLFDRCPPRRISPFKAASLTQKNHPSDASPRPEL